MTSFQATLQGILVVNTGTLYTLIADRLYRSAAPEDPTLPYIVVHEIPSTPAQALKGNVAVNRPVLQFQIFALTDESTIAIKDALQAGLIASGYPVKLEDEFSSNDAISGIRRRDVTARVSHV